MPKYKRDVDVIIEREEVLKFLSKDRPSTYKFIIALLYLTGARPAEIMMLESKNFIFDGDKIRVLIPTKKGGNPRTILLYRDDNIVENYIVEHLRKVRVANKPLINFKTVTRLKQICYDMTDNKYPPYAFRHSRFNKLALHGASPYDIMVMKGAKRFDSVLPYIQKAGMKYGKEKMLELFD